MKQEIHAIKLDHHTKEYEDAKHLLKSAFPKREQSPLWALKLFSKHEGVDFLSFYDNDNNFVGVSYSIHYDNKLLILYLAVNDKLRGKGYGTKIIKYLQEKDNITQTVLDIESPYEQSDNNNERVNRLHFYEHLGFMSTEKEIVEPSCRYLILSTQDSNKSLLDKNEAVTFYEDLTDKLTSGLCKLNIKDIPS